jgi:hypothetical protein
MSMQISTQPAAYKPVAGWRKVLAAVLDFIFVFFIAGYVVGYLTGNLTDDGFQLKGAPALIVFAMIAVYFVVFTKLLGGTIWQRLLGIKPLRAREMP